MEKEITPEEIEGIKSLLDPFGKLKPSWKDNQFEMEDCDFHLIVVKK